MKSCLFQQIRTLFIYIVNSAMSAVFSRSPLKSVCSVWSPPLLLVVIPETVPVLWKTEADITLAALGIGVPFTAMSAVPSLCLQGEMSSLVHAHIHGRWFAWLFRRGSLWTSIIHVWSLSTVQRAPVSGLLLIEDGRPLFGVFSVVSTRLEYKEQMYQFMYISNTSLIYHKQGK